DGREIDAQRNHPDFLRRDLSARNEQAFRGVRGSNDPRGASHGLQKERGEFLAKVRGGIVLAGNGENIKDGHYLLAEVESWRPLRETVKKLRLPGQPERDRLLKHAHRESRPGPGDRSGA